MMLAKKQIKPGVWVLELSGRVQMGPDCKRIDHEVNHHLDQHENSIILDMAGVDHIDSAVIGQRRAGRCRRAVPPAHLVERIGPRAA